MSEHTVDEWMRYGLIVKLAKSLETKSIEDTRTGKGGNGKLGKKALQKYIYLLQELEKIDTGYKFSFYTYGPYSSDLAGDLDVVNSLQGVSITYDPDINAYDISQGENADELMNRSAEYLQRFSSGIDKIINNFGGLLAKELELIATIIFLVRNDQKISESDKDGLLKKVRELKPKYTEEEVRNKFIKLGELGYLWPDAR